MTWPTYWLEETGLVALGLRRYRRDWDRTEPFRWECDYGWHAGFAWRNETAPARWETSDGHRHQAAAREAGHDDPRWPATCAGGCGYAFPETDQWQAWEEPVYVRPADGARLILHTGIGDPPGMQAAGPGATWDGWWMPEDWHGPDGIALVVRCPGGTPGGSNDWSVDAPSTGSGGRWTRTGDPRAADVTATPSIAIGDPAKSGHYHGFLQAGVLTDHLG